MKYFDSYVNLYISYILIIIFFLLLIFFVMHIIFYNKLNKRLDSILGGNKDINDLELALKEYYEKVSTLEKENIYIKKSIDDIYKKINKCTQKVSMLRYNPFNDTGGDLSYVLTMLDENNNGFVINNIFNRYNSISYCKPIVNGVSEYKLSDEEEYIINKAIGIKNKKFEMYR